MSKTISRDPWSEENAHYDLRRGIQSVLGLPPESLGEFYNSLDGVCDTIDQNLPPGASVLHDRLMPSEMAAMPHYAQRLRGIIAFVGCLEGLGQQRVLEDKSDELPSTEGRTPDPDSNIQRSGGGGKDNSSKRSGGKAGS